MLELAEEFLRKEASGSGVQLRMAGECSGSPCISLLDWSRMENRSYPILRLLSDADRKVLNDTQGTGQAYVIKADLQGQRILLLGSAPLGVLYAAATLVQLWSVEDGELVIPEVEVRDYPDFKYRAAADWLMRAELNRWGYDWGDGRKSLHGTDQAQARFLCALQDQHGLLRRLRVDCRKNTRLRRDDAGTELLCP